MKYLYLLPLFCLMSMYMINTPNTQTNKELNTYKELNIYKELNTYKNNNVSCILCKEIVSFINIEIQKSNTTIQDIVKLADDLCHDIAPPIIVEECDFYIKNIEEIINWLTKHISIYDICIKFGFCSNFIL